MASRKIDEIVGEALARGDKDVDTIPSGGYIFSWCCDCNLRHIILYDVVRGKTPSDDVIQVRMIRDDLATELKRHYNRSKKKNRKGK